MLTIVAQREAPDSLEARTARITKDYGRELRRLAKRRESITSVSPYLVAVVAVADSWLYENGVLCHIHDRQLRILDLHNSQSTEIVVDIRRLLDEAIKESRPCRKYKFQLLHFAHDLVSCLYSHANPDVESWLLVFNAREGRIVTKKPLCSSFKLFVRNNAKFLCYGAYSLEGRSGSRIWTVQGFDLTTKTWLSQKLHLPEPLGSDVGSTVCFEIIDGFLYSVSTQTSLEDEEGDWMSFYTCFRFPLAQEGLEAVQHAPREQLWRRCHFEGPIDDGWSFLRLFKDEQTSQITVVESRKEWLSKSSSSRRTYYTTRVVFPDVGGQNQDGAAKVPPSEMAHQTESFKPPTVDFPSPPSRDPHLVHPGDDGSKRVMHTLTKSPVRLYHVPTQTFMDLVDDSSSFDPSSLRLRIRAGSRRRWTAVESEEQNSASEKRHVSPDTFDQEVANLYKQEDVILWPPEPNPAEPDAALAALHRVVTPPGHYGSIRGVGDDRSIVYSIEGAGKTTAVVFLAFDSAIRLKGIQPYPGNSTRGLSNDQTRNGMMPKATQSYSGEGGHKNTQRLESASGPNGTKNGNTALAFPSGSLWPVGGGNSCQWRKQEAAMYQDIAVGFHFSA